MSTKKILEVNSIVKDWRRVALRFALCYPSRYRVGMSCLAVHLIYEMLNSLPNVLCERAFMDISPHSSLESQRKLSDFDVLGFSLQYENDYVNFVKMLLSSKIPPLSSDRSDKHPIIIAGGAAVTANPMPVAPIADAILIGEIEPIFEDLISVLSSGGERERILEELSQIRGVYVHRYGGRVKRVWVSSLNDAPHALHQIIPQVPENSPFSPIFGKSFMLEVTRGCRWGCRFCLEGYNYLPMRERSISVLEEIIEAGLKYTGVNKVVIIGSAAFDHSRIEDLCEYLVDLGCKLSIPSIRASSTTERLIKAIVRGGQRTIALAPETGNDYLRRLIGKGTMSTRDVIEAAKIARIHGIKHVKLYFMIGLPGETLEDIKSIAELARKVADQGFSAPKSVRLSVNPFIPKANTPFQWLEFEDANLLRKKIKFLKSLLAKDPRIELRVGRLREFVVQAFLSTSGTESAKAIIYAAKYGGTLASWRRVERILGFSIERIVSRSRSLEERLPWDNVFSGVSRALLERECLKCLKAIGRVT